MLSAEDLEKIEVTVTRCIEHSESIASALNFCRGNDVRLNMLEGQLHSFREQLANVTKRIKKLEG